VRNGGKQATVQPMARTAFCPTCARTVYIEMADSLVCPVCSGPILEAVPETAADEAPKPSSETESTH
jgi:rubredoxin